MVYLDGRPFWLRRVNSDATFEALLAWVRDALNGKGSVLPEPLDARAFAWTGGGPGPEPPLPDA